jgi:hypothetical protein
MTVAPVVPRCAHPNPALLRRQLGFDVAKALAVKVLAILAISMFFFGSGNRPHVDPASTIRPCGPLPAT